MLSAPSLRHGARRAAAQIAAVAARSEGIGQESIGAAAGRPGLDVGSRRASSAPRTWDSAGQAQSFWVRGLGRSAGGAHVTISEAEAEPLLISTMIGLLLVRSPARALKRWVSSALRPRVDTISPFSRNASETEIA